MLILPPRAADLGGDSPLEVRRTLPALRRSFVGAWCFVDHYGPTAIVDAAAGMDVAPHPHCGLQTVSWLFDGQIEHHDSGGVSQLVRPGEVNLMTSGLGIAHSEVSTPDTARLHGVQLWVALPGLSRDGGRDFQHHAVEPVDLPDGAGQALVFVGELAGHASPLHTFTPLLGAELRLRPNATVELPVDPSWEHGFLIDSGEVRIAASLVAPGELGIVDAGPDTLRISVGGSGARIVMLGGQPFDEEIVMWWNFVARSHDEIVAARELWMSADSRFGKVEGYGGRGERIPAPPLPGGELRARNRNGRVGW